MSAQIEATAEETAVELRHNVHSQPGTPLYERFARAAAAEENQSMRLAFHGTKASNVDSILEHGLKPELRGTSVGQKLGSGEYCAARLSVALKYCHGGNLVITCAVLERGARIHTCPEPWGEIVIVSEPAFLVPIAVLELPAALARHALDVFKAQLRTGHESLAHWHATCQAKQQAQDVLLKRIARMVEERDLSEASELYCSSTEVREGGTPPFAFQVGLRLEAVGIDHTLIQAMFPGALEALAAHRAKKPKVQESSADEAEASGGKSHAVPALKPIVFSSAAAPAAATDSRAAAAIASASTSVPSSHVSAAVAQWLRGRLAQPQQTGQHGGHCWPDRVVNCILRLHFSSDRALRKVSWPKLRESLGAEVITAAEAQPQEADPMTFEPLGEDGEPVVRLPCRFGEVPCTFNLSTVTRCFRQSTRCPCCQHAYDLRGPQPSGEMIVFRVASPCSGHEGVGTLAIDYLFQSGVQNERHPRAGTPYRGRSIRCYYPDNQDGSRAVRLLRSAFTRGILFRVGDSLSTLEQNIVTFGLHQKTRRDGGAEQHGWPDPTYVDRLASECAGAGMPMEEVTSVLSFLESI